LTEVIIAGHNIQAEWHISKMFLVSLRDNILEHWHSPSVPGLWGNSCCMLWLHKMLNLMKAIRWSKHWAVNYSLLKSRLYIAKVSASVSLVIICWKKGVFHHSLFCVTVKVISMSTMHLGSYLLNIHHIGILYFSVILCVNNVLLALTSQFVYKLHILSRVWVTIDGVWIGNLIYWTLSEGNCK
jgi:hypothetical protein